ncbi:hypothetical protein BT67DRAFT_313965 [Trichocladium antarcticum]|uniref:Tuberous sclerosis 1 n=1 Tax=Trichocladium antarcticum TaxID=1450529 RepID=A0AAN6ZDX2_9PEZI|nr:hypothetical protein BT67DRAFT_313965 [Trichocladium antarcticum]
MTSSGSSKDLAKSLNGFLQSPSLPLPTEISTSIAGYHEKHNRPDEASSDRLGEELLAIWDKTVRDHPEKYTAFLTVLRQLRPGLRTPTRVFKWWDRLLDPVLDHVAREKGLAREVMENTLDLLSADEYDDPAVWSDERLAPLVSRLLSRWMDARETQADLRPSADLKEQMIKEALMAFGKKDPKAFMTALNDFVAKREHRNSALSLLCAFVSSGPPHLHLILQTPLFVNILHSLQKDESTATVNLAVIALVMILPFIPSSLVPFLPTLFNVYARLLFWDRDSYFAQQNTEMGAEKAEAGAGAGPRWDKVLLDPDYDGHSLSHLPEYFTVLYGLYPINFLDYIRKPHRYLRHANNVEDIDVQAMEIRDRSERFRKQHLLHPNFYNLTIESEKTDMSRWIKSEADEVRADCMALVIDPTPALAHICPTIPLPGSSASLTGYGPDQEAVGCGLLGNPASADADHQAPLSVRSLSVGHADSTLGRRGSQSSHPSGYDLAATTRSRGPGDVSPTLSPTVVHSSSQSQLQDTIYANKASKGGLYQSRNTDSVPSLLLSPLEPAAERSPLQVPVGHGAGGTGGSSVGSDEQMGHLQHQRLRLINELQYERFIKQQHMIHMGELRRRQIRVSATEAETQNLVMANRSLKQRLDEAKRGEAQIRKEFDHRRNMAKKWENNLSSKLRAVREEQKKWDVQGNGLRQQLAQAQEECEGLRRVVEDAEKKRVESEQNIEAVDIGMATIERLKGEIARLSASERAFQGKDLSMKTAMQEAAAAEARAKQMATELAAREEQLHHANRHYEMQIDDLETQLAQARKDSQRKPSSEVVAACESARSATRAKNTELQKQHSALVKKYTALHSTLLDLQCSTEQGGGMPLKSPLGDGDGDSLATARSAATMGTRQRAISAPDAADGMVRNTASPGPELVPGRPSTPSGPVGPSDPSVPGKSSPQAERFFGRGVQNAAREERKEKKEEKSDKKDKKTGPTLRGIRFV